LTKLYFVSKGNIDVVQEWITNEVSSTRIRRALRRKETVKFFVPDSVIDYIEREGLYKAEK
jgi:nicotinamide mononucleotide adenylyltransferase